jgi:hypothetical protein
MLTMPGRQERTETDGASIPKAPAKSTIVPFARLISGRMATPHGTDQRWPLLTATHGTGHQGRSRENAGTLSIATSA